MTTDCIQRYLSQGLPSEAEVQEIREGDVESLGHRKQQPLALAFLHLIFFCETTPSHSSGGLALERLFCPRLVVWLLSNL